MIFHLPLPDLCTLTHSEKDSLILALVAQAEALTVRVSTLEGMLRKDSHNSGKPPSSDGLGKKTKSLREASGKKPGGQPGHKGHTLKQVAHPTQIITHALPEHCEGCGCLLAQQATRVAQRRQVVDIPIVACDVVEHRTLALVCQCGRRHVSAFPPAVTEAVQYGPNVRALGVHLTQGQLLPFARAAQLITDIYGIAISPGTLAAWVSQACITLQGTADDIAHSVHTAFLVHADESGLRVAGKLHWLHVAANETHTWYGVHPKRGMEAIAAFGILPQRRGALIHDCWAPYWQLDCVHGLCNAHLLRELVYVKDITGHDWPEQMMQLLVSANAIATATRRAGIAFTEDNLAAFHTLYHGILRDGDMHHPQAHAPTGKRGRVKQSVPFNLLRRLRQYADAVLLFLRDPRVPFTNNLGERAIRMPKVKQKISGCFRTVEGAHNFCVIRSCLDTLAKQGHGMLEVLRRAFAGNPIQPARG
jgi:transposase